MLADIARILGYPIAFIGGLFTMYASQFIQEYFVLRKELRDSLRVPYQQIAELIASGQERSYRLPPNQITKHRAMKLAVTVERYGKKELALDIRQYIKYWQAFSESLKKVKTGKLDLQDIIRHAELRVSVDNLADFIMDELAKDYIFFPNVWIKVKRIWALHIAPKLRHDNDKKS